MLLGVEFPPPQALRQNRPRVAATHRIQTEQQRRFLNRTKQKVNAKAATGMDPIGVGGWVLALVLAVRVSVVEAAVPGGITVAGEKLHDVPAGNPEQLNETAESNPFTDLTEMVAFALCPESTARDAGEAVTEKSGIKV